jgi:hypothetical protein
MDFGNLPRGRFSLQGLDPVRVKIKKGFCPFARARTRLELETLMINLRRSVPYEALSGPLGP